MSDNIKVFNSNGHTEYGHQIADFEKSHEYKTLLNCLTDHGTPRTAAVNALRRAFSYGWNAGKERVIIRYDRKKRKLEPCEGGPIDPAKFQEMGEIVLNVISPNLDHKDLHESNRRGRPSKLIYSREECAFNYCPTPAECRSKNKCCNG